MPTRRRRKASKRQAVDLLQHCIFVIGNPLGYIVGQNPSGAGPKFDSEDHVRECWHEVREEIITDFWKPPPTYHSPPPDYQEQIDRQGMPVAFWLYDAPDIAAQRRDGESDRELLARFEITSAQDAISYPSRQ